MDEQQSPAGQTPVSAAPSRLARALALLAVLIGGACGALIGYAFVDLQCEGDCAVPAGIGLLIGAVFAAAGIAVVVVLVLRAMGEWTQVRERQARRDRTR